MPCGGVSQRRDRGAGRHVFFAAAPPAADGASVNIRDGLLELGGWSESSAFDGSPVWRRADRLLVTIREHHLHVDHVDVRVRDELGVTPAPGGLAAEAPGFRPPATFEATHPGPYLETPTFYIEVGSGTERWTDPRAGAILARTVMAAEGSRDPVAIGVSGGRRR